MSISIISKIVILFKLGKSTVDTELLQEII